MPKSGLHNPLKNPERYQTYGSVIKRAAHELGKPETMDFRSPDSTRRAQELRSVLVRSARHEAVLSNFGGDNPRFGDGEQVAGDRVGQQQQLAMAVRICRADHAVQLSHRDTGAADDRCAP